MNRRGKGEGGLACYEKRVGENLTVNHAHSQKGNK